MRVVFDSNIFVSALVFPGGKADQALERVLVGSDHLLISTPIVHEVLEVLSHKFSRDGEELARVAVYLTELGECVESIRRLNVLEDDPNNRILECAVSGQADAIVTDDKAMLRLGRYESISIMTLRDYLA